MGLVKDLADINFGVFDSDKNKKEMLEELIITAPLLFESLFGYKPKIIDDNTNLLFPITKDGVHIEIRRPAIKLECNGIIFFSSIPIQPAYIIHKKEAAILKGYGCFEHEERIKFYYEKSCPVCFKEFLLRVDNKYELSKNMFTKLKIHECAKAPSLGVMESMTINLDAIEPRIYKSD